MIEKLSLYLRTIYRMRPIQIYSRLKRILGLESTFGVRPQPMPEKIRRFESVKELDYDAVFLLRFPADEFIAGRMTFLHETEQFDWDGEWDFPNRSALWNYNLHYFEFLMPMVYSYEATHDVKYLKGVENFISGWIEHNPRGVGVGWAPYTISIRLVYWFSCFFTLSDVLEDKFKIRMLSSMYEQYTHLSVHLEKDLLANHYLENLKAMVLCAVAFCDERMLVRALAEFKNQCEKQILPDGVHYELSPMYHQIVLENVLRVTAALRSVGRQDHEIESLLPNMLAASVSFEGGLERIPLFNDGGCNVAKSLDALLLTAKNHFGLEAKRRDSLPDSGFYFFRMEPWTLIVDAGLPGARENPGHVQCDAMSFELFRAGHPVLVNCGTYAYQCADRPFFRSTSAHNTLSIAGAEQSECWSAFRMGKGSSVKVKDAGKNGIQMIMTDQCGNTAERWIRMENEKLLISDTVQGKSFQAWIHLNDFPEEKIKASGQDLTCQHRKQWYSEEYGERKQIDVLTWTARNQITIVIDLSE